MHRSYKTGEYANALAEFGYSQDEIDKKISDAFERIFFRDGERIYFENDDDTGYMVDTGNDDVRTEGQSYGMMIAVQMDRKDIFDRIWAWTKKYMYLDSGDYTGYFGWTNKTDGTRNSEGPAPDGEEFFAMSLLFAGRRWGDGNGIFNYTKEAREMLHHMVHKPVDPMFDPETKLIRFIPNCDFTDPSYHLPHFYELFAEYGNPEDKEFFLDAARLSREFLHKACNAETGLNPNQSHYDGTPMVRHEYSSCFFSDAYRTALNIALDWVWFKKDPWQQSQAASIQRFFEDESKFDHVYSVNGEVLLPQKKEPDAMGSGMLHPLGLRATTCASSLASDGELREKFVRLFWSLKLRTDRRRYYDNLLYFFSLLALAGRYRIY
ncbi:MAG: glycosyl hydrolase family 8 [Oscillospiraceae bacterium]|nr:glycosyl hydrolase family 8 [Oscillospiraceae bacterium]MCL2278469.1 glycosyl hydrolase family 8 [Oscillospiraceae bacterium]